MWAMTSLIDHCPSTAGSFICVVPTSSSKASHRARSVSMVSSSSAGFTPVSLLVAPLPSAHTASAIRKSRREEDQTCNRCQQVELAFTKCLYRPARQPPAGSRALTDRYRCFAASRWQNRPDPAGRLHAVLGRLLRPSSHNWPLSELSLPRTLRAQRSHAHSAC